MKKSANEIVSSVAEELGEIISSPEYQKMLREMSTQFLEDTDLVSVVAKSDTPDRANAAAKFLQQNGIEARAKEDTKFDTFNPTEQAAWGVLVRPHDTKDAAQKLKSVSKGLTFDPYVTAGQKLANRRV